MKIQLGNGKNHFINLLLIFVSVCPNFIFLINEILFINYIFILIYLFTILILYLVIYRLNFEISGIKITNLFLSTIIILGFDKNLRLWLLFKNLFSNDSLKILNYLSSLVIIIFFFTIFYKILSKSKTNIKLLSIIIISIISILNIFTEYNVDTKYKNLSKIISLNSNTSANSKNVIILLDGQIGPGGIDIDIEKDLNFNVTEEYSKFFKSHDFQVYSNAYSLYNETIYSVPALLNFNHQIKENNTSNYYTPSNFDKNSTFYLHTNKFFETKNKRYLTKNRIFNFCNQEVDACYSFNHNYPEKYVTKFESFFK